MYRIFLQKRLYATTIHLSTDATASTSPSKRPIIIPLEALQYLAIIQERSPPPPRTILFDDFSRMLTKAQFSVQKQNKTKCSTSISPIWLRAIIKCGHCFAVWKQRPLGIAGVKPTYFKERHRSHVRTLVGGGYHFVRSARSLLLQPPSDKHLPIPSLIIFTPKTFDFSVQLFNNLFCEHFLSLSSRHFK